MDGYRIVQGRRFFDVVATYAGGGKYLTDVVTPDGNVWRTLEKARIGADARNHPHDSTGGDPIVVYPYRPIDPDHLPKSLKLKRARPKVLPELAPMIFMTGVSDRVRHEIEALQTDGLRFYPVDLVDEDTGERLAYHWMQFTEEIDCICFSCGGFERKTAESGSEYWTRLRGEHDEYLIAEKVGQRHVLLPRQRRGGPTLSDTLVARLGDSFLPKISKLMPLGVVTAGS
jgi:hypothetical protein